MADYRYLVDADIYWNDKGEEFQEKASFLQNCAKDLSISLTEENMMGLIKEAYKLIAPLELFGCCPYYIESMKRDYVWPYETETDTDAYKCRVLVFATAYFLLGSSGRREMRSYYNAFIGQQGGIIDQFKAWEAAAEKLLFNYAFEKKNYLEDISRDDFYRNPWDKITDDFNSEVMVKILDQYNLENKQRVLDYMEAFCLIRPKFAYMLNAERPGSIAKFREWIGKDVRFGSKRMAFEDEREKSCYNKDGMIVYDYHSKKSCGRDVGLPNLPKCFFKKLNDAIWLFRYDDEFDFESDAALIRHNVKILNQAIVIWNKISKMKDIPKTVSEFDVFLNADTQCSVWQYLYALLFVKKDRKEWEDLLMENMERALIEYHGEVSLYEAIVFDRIASYFKNEENNCLMDADFQANLVEWKHLDEKDWAYATRGYAKDDMLIFIKAGRTHVEQWRIAEALEKSYAKLVDSDDMYKIKNFNALVDLENIKDEILQGTYLEGAKPIDSEEMYKRLKRKNYEEMEKELEELKDENERLKASPLQTGVKWTGNKIDLLRIIDVLWEMNKIEYDGPEGGNSKKIVFEKLGPAFGKDLSGGTKTISNNESGMNSDNPPALSIFEAMLTKKRDLIDEKDVKK